ncbi:MAG: molybdopterin-dependent oxidoreductase [Chitinophagaceae bacterium]
MKNSTISRRHFLQVTSLSTGGMLIGFPLLSNWVKNVSPEVPGTALNMFIKIGSDNSIVLLAPNPEIGQGVKTTLPAIVAEELAVDWKQVSIEYAPIESKYGRQTAGGSGSVRGRFNELRTAGAAAREMLVTAAAQTWNVPVTECIAENGEVLHKASGKKLSYGSLAAKAATIEPPAKPALKATKDFQYIGSRIKDVDAEKIATGQPLFGIDTRRKGMLFAMVARPPAYGKTLGTVDDSAALKINGVKQVVKLKNSVAVLANSTWAAKKGRDALVIQWNASDKLENTKISFRFF